MAVVFLSNSADREIWPYPGFDTARRHAEVLKALRAGCPEVEFVPLVVAVPDDLPKATALQDQVDAYLVYTVTLNWRLGGVLTALGKLGKPMLVADEYLGGSGVFLTGVSRLARTGVEAAAVSTTRLSDLVAACRPMANLKKPGVTPASFARQCEKAYRGTFGGSAHGECREDRVKLAPIGESLRRLKRSRFVIVGPGRSVQEREFLGATGIYVDFDQFKAYYDRVDGDKAAECAALWAGRAEKVVEPTPDWLQKAGAVYLATVALMKKFGAETITMNCLGGFAQGQLPAYPCLGFMQILDDGEQGVCEAMPDDSLSMILARLLTGRAGYVSDPALDTSTNQIVYAHCMAMTKVLGSEGPASRFRIRTLHNRDPRGCCAQAFLPEGYMTTSFRTNIAQKKMVVHQARTVGNLDADRGCRTQLLAEVCGDIEKLLHEWDRFGWHRVTVYGDIKEPLVELGRALGLEVVEEA